MSLFHIAIAGNYITMMQLPGGYTIERKLEDLPEEAIADLKSIFRTTQLKRAHWTKVAHELPLASALKHYFLFEKAEELKQIEEEYEVLSAMAMYADCLPVLHNEYAI